jgi:DNA polymerase III epsilon subunit-like protein
MIVIDIETTGEIPWLHSILSIGAVDFSNPENQFYGECRMREGSKLDPVALQINGFTREGIKARGKKPLKTLLEEFLDWTSKIEDITLAGLNHYMDVYFINHSLELCRIRNPFKYRLVDIHTITYANYLMRGIKPPLENKGSAMKSNVIQEYCGLPVEPYPHNALTGAKLEAEELCRLIYGKNLLSEYRKFKIPEYLKK